MRIVDRGTKVVLVGDDADTRPIAGLLDQLLATVRSGHSPTLDDVDHALLEAQRFASTEDALEPDDAPSPFVQQPKALRSDIRVRPRTHGQRKYLDSIHSCEMTLVAGPAGTGKTYLAMAAAVSALLNKQVKRLVLTRPAVEAGENLGFLPGDIEQKVSPYLRPLYDALYSMVDVTRAQRLIDQQQIEVAPLAFMRGRTLDRAFVILDEAQNTTTDQMLMFLTRIGMGSCAVVTGDVTQVDLPKSTPSGLIEARKALRNIPGIGIVELTKRDVVRNPLVQRIIQAYEGLPSSRANTGTDAHRIP